MNLASAKGIIEVAKSRGFKLLLNPGPPPMPVLRRPPNVKANDATPALLDALRAWRLEIMEELKGEEWQAPIQAPNEAAPTETPKEEPTAPLPRLKEFLWATGYKSIQHPDSDLAAIPTGAWWWRWQDETEWQAIPDRPGVGVQPPEVNA